MLIPLVNYTERGMKSVILCLHDESLILKQFSTS